MTQPSVGRIVHYASEMSDEPFAAIVTQVLMDPVPEGQDMPLVNLSVFWPQGGVLPKQNVAFDESGAPGTWSWPPRV